MSEALRLASVDASYRKINTAFFLSTKLRVCRCGISLERFQVQQLHRRTGTTDCSLDFDVATLSCPYHNLVRDPVLVFRLRNRRSLDEFSASKFDTVS